MTGKCIAIVGRENDTDPWGIITTYEPSFLGSEEKAIVAARSAITRWYNVLGDMRLAITRTNITSCSTDRDPNNKHLEFVG